MYYLFIVYNDCVFIKIKRHCTHTIALLCNT